MSPERCTIKFVRNSTYATERPGIIDELPFQEGDFVHAGDLLVRLRDEVAQANRRLRAAQAQMDTPIQVAQKERDAAKLDLDAKTHANSIASSYPESEIERARIVYEARELQIQQAEDELSLKAVALEQAEAELKSYSVLAKFDGLVTLVHKQVGEAVNLGDEIITIIDPTRIRVEGRLRYQDARRVQIGDPVRIQLDLSRLEEDHLKPSYTRDSADTIETAVQREPLPEEQQVFAGRVGFIGVTTDDDQGLLDEFRIWAEVENRDNILLEGIPARMTIQVQSRVTKR